MNKRKIAVLFLSGLLVFVSLTAAVADDLDWVRDLNVSVKNDPSGFSACLATRFQIGDAEVSAVLGDVANPADAYLIFRLGEMASKSPDYVLRKYKHEKKRGWGALAKSLGIKPGSREFQELKRGPDIEYVSYKKKAGNKNKHKKKS